MSDIDPLFQLDFWARKGRQFRIHGGPFQQPGDGVYVELREGSKVIVVGEYDIRTIDGEGNPRLPGLDELIAEALRRWSDPSPPIGG